MTRAAVRTVFVCALAAFAAVGWADDFEVAATDAAPPDAVAAPIAEAVGPGSLVVSGGGETVAEFWLREDVPLKDPPAEILEVSFGALEEGVLVGVMRVAQEWHEYKGLAVEPGVYTLRYAHRPADGNHMGVSMYRDFLLLTPAADDTAVDVEWSAEELSKKSMAATSRQHPATLALFPSWEEVAEPSILENDAGQPMLAVPLSSLVIGLTVEGEGEH